MFWKDSIWRKFFDCDILLIISERGAITAAIEEAQRKAAERKAAEIAAKNALFQKAVNKKGSLSERIFKGKPED